MFYDETQAIKTCIKEPIMIFELIKEGHYELVDKMLARKIIDINTVDSNGNDVLSWLLKAKQYEIVLKYINDDTWDINHQNNEGDTFAHKLVSINYVSVGEIFNSLKDNERFIPNIKNNKGETILDKSINDNYIYTTAKILEDERFTNIDVISFKNLYEKYIKSSNYGRYSKLNNFEIIIDNLEEKKLSPKMSKLVGFINRNIDKIRKELQNNSSLQLETFIKNILEETV